MRWIGRRESGNVEDRRGSGGSGMVVGGGIGTVIIGLIIYLLGGDPSMITNVGTESTAPSQVATNDPNEDQAARFVKVVLADTEDVWAKLLAQQGQRYDQPVMVLFRGATQSGCGGASAESGPFYCPADDKLYLDLSFQEELARRFGASGDFAMAYVVAHEVAHHIQNMWGLTNKMGQMRARISRTDYNRLSVRLELQADFLAGVWAHHSQKMFNSLEQGDIEEALRAASAIGDDRIQQQTQGRVVPDAFTHGTSAQRVYWFTKGYKTGDINQGDTFNSNEDAHLQ